MKRFRSIWLSYNYWLSSLFLITGLSLAAQEPARPVCSEMIQEGKNEESAGNLDAALKAYLNALNCDSKLAGTVGPRIDTVFTLIQQQKKTAEYNQELAERRLVEVEKQKNIVNSLNDLREFRSWGDMWFDNQNWEKAADNYKRAAAIDPNDPYLAERVKICASDQRDTIFSLLNGIRQRSLDPDRGDFYLEQTRKKQIFLNATIGPPNPMGAIQFLRNSQGAVAITFLIAGKPGDETAGFEDGDVYQTHPHWFWAYHTGKIPGASSRELSKHSIAINLCNWGALVKNEDGTFSPPFLKGRVIVPREEVIEYELPYRGYVYYHRYTDEQVESLRKLLIYLTEVYDIPKGYNDDMFEVTRRALEGRPGIFSQASIRKDKPGLHPQPELIATLNKIELPRKTLGSKQAFFRNN